MKSKPQKEPPTPKENRGLFLEKHICKDCNSEFYYCIIRCPKCFSIKIEKEYFRTRYGKNSIPDSLLKSV
jgi:predicted Zn-ribbon and HTH transcriptional regulator